MSCPRLVIKRQRCSRSAVYVKEHITFSRIGICPHRSENSKSWLCYGFGLCGAQHVFELSWHSAFVRCTHCDVAIWSDLLMTIIIIIMKLLLRYAMQLTLTLMKHHNLILISRCYNDNCNVKKTWISSICQLYNNVDALKYILCYVINAY